MAPTRAVSEPNGRRRWWHHHTSHPSASGLLVAQFRASTTEQPVGGAVHKESPAPPIHLTPPHVMSCTHTLGLGPVSSTQNSPPGSFWQPHLSVGAKIFLCVRVCREFVWESLGGSPASFLSFEGWKPKWICDAMNTAISGAHEERLTHSALKKYRQKKGSQWAVVRGESPNVTHALPDKWQNKAVWYLIWALYDKA